MLIRMPASEREKTTVTLPSELKARAKQEGVNFSETLERALLRKLNGEDDRAGVAESGNAPALRAGGRVEGSLNEVLSDFKDFLVVDKDLSERTVRGYFYDVRQLFSEYRLNEIRKKDIRKWLKNYENKNTRANKVKAVKAFFRDFLNRPRLVDSFQIPRTPRNESKPPTLGELEQFYGRLKTAQLRAFFLTKASSGLRLKELTGLKMENIDLSERMLLPNHDSRTKRSYISFYNAEAEREMGRFIDSRERNDERFFRISSRTVQDAFAEVSEKSGVKIVPKDLRKWFVNEMKRENVDPGYIDAFCGRVPKSVQDSHYTDLSPERLKEVYEDADIEIFS